MRLGDALAMASGNMWRNKTRTLLTIVAIFVAAFTITLTTAIGAGVSKYLDDQIQGFGAPSLIQVGAAVETTDGPSEYSAGNEEMFGVTVDVLTPEDVELIRGVDHITEVVPFVAASPSYIQAGESAQYGLFAQQIMVGQNLDVVAGTLPEDGAGSEIILTTDYATALGFASPEDAVGATVDLGVLDPLQAASTVQATVSGVMNDSIIIQGRLWMNDTLHAAVADIVNRGLPAEAVERYAFVLAYADSTDPRTLNSVKAELETLGYGGQTVEDQVGIVKQIFGAITAVLTVFGIIALLAASLGVVNTLFMSVQDRTSEIGLMKANGLSSARVFGLFSFEALLLGLWGSVLGVLAAWGLGQGLNALATSSFLAYLPGFDLTLFPAGSVAVIIGLILVITLLAGTLPARRASQLNPIEALRYE